MHTMSTILFCHGFPMIFHFIEFVNGLGLCICLWAWHDESCIHCHRQTINLSNPCFAHPKLYVLRLHSTKTAINRRLFHPFDKTFFIAIGCPFSIDRQKMTQFYDSLQLFNLEFKRMKLTLTFLYEVLNLPRAWICIYIIFTFGSVSCSGFERKAQTFGRAG